MKRLLFTSLLVALLVFDSCCDSSDPNAELKVTFIDSLYSAPKDLYTSVTALKAKKNIDIRYGSSYSYDDRYLLLPVSYSSDTTTYIFSNSTRSDTLSVAYLRAYDLYSNKCGYEIKISNFKIIKPTSFKETSINGNEANIHIN